MRFELLMFQIITYGEKDKKLHHVFFIKSQ